MSGIYIHIPWCRKVCFYCDFHFSVSISNKDELLECLKIEIDLQRNYFANEIIESIYFGGGTPSVLKPLELRKILDKIYSTFNVSDNAEITLEGNPDDLSFSYLKDLIKIGINRLSIGVQSFFDDDLRWMNRRHDTKQSLQSILDSKEAGFNNISIDLIYGLPGLGLEKWCENIKIAFENKIQHLSAYHLTLENKTVYSYKVKKGQMKEPDEESGVIQFEMLMNMADEEGFIHYEISNFSLPSHNSIHNKSYWLQKPYLGIGPSANSFDGNTRRWNVRNNSLYIKNIRDGIISCAFEELSMKEKYNEYILTSLRTIWGIDISVIEQRFGSGLADYFRKQAFRFIKEGKLEEIGNRIRITRSAKLFSDGIISDLFQSD